MKYFFQSVKSTIDKLGVDLAKGFDPDLKFVDLDDTALNHEILTKGEDSIVWELATLEQDPIDPLYTIIFGVGARTMDDPSRYSMARILGEVSVIFTKGSSIDIFDFSTDGDGVTKQGFMVITDVMVDPQMFDREAGIRLVMVTAKAVRAI